MNLLRFSGILSTFVAIAAVTFADAAENGQSCRIDRLEVQKDV